MILAMGATRMLDSLSDVAYGRLQQQERMDRVADRRSSAACSPWWSCPPRCSSAAGWWTACWRWPSPGRSSCCSTTCPNVPGRGVPRLLRSRGNDVRDPAFPRPHSRAVELAGAAARAGHVLSSLNVNVPRYFIEGCVGKAGLGVFAGCVGLFSAVYLVQVAIGQAALPRLAQYHAAGCSAATSGCRP